MAWPNGQTRVVSLTVQNAQVSGSGTHPDFPVLLDRDNFPDEIWSPTDGNRAQANGGDLRFALNQDGTGQIPVELVSTEYDSADAAGDAEIQVWVKLNLNTADDTPFYCAYNTAGTTVADGPTDTFGRNAVWADYLAVFHLDDTPATALDSTGNGLDMSSSTGTPVSLAGKIGDGVDFDSGDFISGSNEPSLENKTAISFQGWIDLLDQIGDRSIISQRILSANSAGFEVFFDKLGFVSGRSNTFSVGVDAGINDAAIEGAANAGSLGEHLVHVTFQGSDASGLRLYVDGSEDANSPVSTSTVANTGANSVPLSIGASNAGRDATQSIIDETRIYDGVLSADWITTEYNNQNNPSLFVVEGVPQPVVGGGGFPPIMYKGVNLGSTGIR